METRAVLLIFTLFGAYYGWGGYELLQFTLNTGGGDWSDHLLFLAFGFACMSILLAFLAFILGPFIAVAFFLFEGLYQSTRWLIRRARA